MSEQKKKRENKFPHLFPIIGNKRGQVTIFIIVALVIVVFGILLYFFYPNIKTTFGQELKNPSAYMQSCLEEDVFDAVNILSLQGGSINPNHYMIYDDSKIGYVCYTNKYYKTCTVQIPFIASHIEKEIKKKVESNVDSCLDSMIENFKGRGYNVDLRKKDFNVQLEPKKIVLNFNSSLTLEKDATETYDSIRIVMNNNIYELANIAQSILDWETKVGDAETTLYMNYYKHIKVEKKKQTDGTTIYIITNRNTDEKFQFASRSVAWPPGLGIKNEK